MSASPRSPQSRLLAKGAGWSAYEFVCASGPGDPVFEERHSGVSIAYVRAGCFRYRTHAGDSLLYPGAFLLGASGRCYECGHEHGVGDRCLSFNFADDYFDEIAHGASARLGFEFQSASLPPCPELAPLATAMDALDSAPAIAVETLAVRLVFAAVQLSLRRSGLRSSAVSVQDRRRVAAALQLIERDPSAELDLDTLARAAKISKFHFLRLFARVTGQSPHRYLMGERLRRAARALAQGRRPITEIAYESGFGDLSHFNARFKAVYGLPPNQWRGRRL